MWVMRIGLFRIGWMTRGLLNHARLLFWRSFARGFPQCGGARRTVAFRPGGNWSMTSSLTGVSPDRFAEVPTGDAFSDELARMIDPRRGADMLNQKVALEHIGVALERMLVLRQPGARRDVIGRYDKLQASARQGDRLPDGVHASF